MSSLFILILPVQVPNKIYESKYNLEKLFEEQFFVEVEISGIYFLLRCLKLWHKEVLMDYPCSFGLLGRWLY